LSTEDVVITAMQHSASIAQQQRSLRQLVLMALGMQSRKHTALTASHCASFPARPSLPPSPPHLDHPILQVHGVPAGALTKPWEHLGQTCNKMGGREKHAGTH
jgi:hypothetical protein